MRLVRPQPGDQTRVLGIQLDPPRPLLSVGSVMCLDLVIQLVNVVILIESLRLLGAQVGDWEPEAVIQQPLDLGVDLAGDVGGVGEPGEAPAVHTDPERDDALPLIKAVILQEGRVLLHGEGPEQLVDGVREVLQVKILAVIGTSLPLSLSKLVL